MRSAAKLIATPVNDPTIHSPALQVSKKFAFQSYFDNTLLEKALLSQPPSTTIIDPTETQVRGYGVGLHPSSETPVAIEFRAGNSGGSSTFVLKPGQVLFPSGRRREFSGLKYGLPYGWLGGGNATIVIFSTPDAEVSWGGEPEVIFHRARYAIKQPADLTDVGSFNNAPKNWPLRFPWTQALQGSSSLPQKGKPLLAITQPTKAIIALRGKTSLAAAANCRVIIQGTNDFNRDSSDAVVLTATQYATVVFPSFTRIGTSGNMATHDPMVFVKDDWIRLGADDGGVLFVDNTGAATLNGCFADVVRYGRL